jgi:dipeptidase D
MNSPLLSLEPRLVWQHFDAIRQVPRPSKHEEKIRAHVRAWAEARGFSVKEDAAGNMVVKVPATPGHESAPTVVLQGHLDMVAEKNADVSFDFLNDPIQVRIVGDYVYATGTTLGADNGIGVAAAMAVAEDPEAVHGPLELLFTVDEETGLTGAMKLDPTLLSGRTLLNLDTEEDGAFYIGCAGGADAHAVFTVALEPLPPGHAALAVRVRGLRGGHSGVDIHENRGNALKFLARLLAAGRKVSPELRIASIGGGSKHNAIPREADAVITVPASQLEAVKQAIFEMAGVLREEFGEVDPGQKVEVEETTTAQVFAAADGNRLLDALLACPHGVLAMSRAVPGLVETSNNLAVVTTEGNQVKVVTSSRSSVMPSLRATLQQVEACFRLAGAAVEVHDGYPGWKPNPNSQVLQLAKEVFRKEFGRDPEVKAIHAGLECGLIGEKFPGMDMLSLGPQIESPHSPDERVKISTVASFYRLLKAILREMA